MQEKEHPLSHLMTRDLVDVIIRVGLVAIVFYLCAKVFAPFALIMLWALILAVALYPLHKKIAKKLNDQQGRAATLLALSGILLLGVPSALLGSSLADHVYQIYLAIHNNSLSISPPADSVAAWPLIGGKVFALWSDASSNLPDLVAKMEPQLRNISKFMLGTAASTAGSVFMFIGALVIAGIMLAYGQSGSDVMLRILTRMGGEGRGLRMHKLSTATIRSVATGVVGVAFIQAILLGIGFMLADIPAAGLWALLVLILGIVQLPVMLVTIPFIAYIWLATDASTLSNVFFTIYFIVGGLVDNVLKPMLLGRGVEAPMPVILIGALGGMVSSGLIGLFLGAVILAIGYQVFMDWVDDDQQAKNSADVSEETASEPGTVSD